MINLKLDFKNNPVRVNREVIKLDTCTVVLVL
jgi:hypothetical protein